MADEIYKVLWIDDDDTIVNSTQLAADEFNLELDRFSNWDEAKPVLTNNFEDYSAIVLDAFCKIHRGEKFENETFIPVVLGDLAAIFERKQKVIPWFIYSAGTMDNFNFVIQTARERRVDIYDDVHDVVFIKGKRDDDPQSERALFYKIAEIAGKRFENSVLYRHKDVFSYLGKDKLIGYSDARRYMIKMLDALYFPEDNLQYQYEANPLRKVLEWLFRSAHKRGLLPEECFNKGNVVLAYCSLFLAGKNVKYSKEHSDFYVRWGEESDNDGGHVFPPALAKSVKDILDFTGAGSHTDEEEPYLIDEETKEVFFSYVMQLCYVIRWFGKYVEKHPDVEKNRKMHRRIEVVVPAKPEPPKPEKKKLEKKKPAVISREDMVGKEGYVLNDGTFFYVLSCKLSPDCAALVKQLDWIRIDDVEENSDEKTKKEVSFHRHEDNAGDGRINVFALCGKNVQKFCNFTKIEFANSIYLRAVKQKTNVEF